MSYVPTYINKTAVPGGAECTMILVDNAGVYPDVRVTKSFPGRTVAQLTNAFLLPFARTDAAIAIQTEIVRRADVLLDGLVAQAWTDNMPVAFAAFRAQVQAALAGQSIDHAAVEARIQAAWAAYAVSGRLNAPAVTIAFNAPDVPAKGEFVTVSVSN